MSNTSTPTHFFEALADMGIKFPHSSDYTFKLTEIVEEIRILKQKHNVVVLSHYYMPPELQVLQQSGGIADYVGDSLGLSQQAEKTDADYIVFCGVRFMAETAKILNPLKTVLLPDMEAGCSLASSISGDNIRELRKQYPGLPVIAYVNTYAETKAEADICCTSRNALPIAKSFEQDTIIFIPDVFMGRNLQKKLREEYGKTLILWDGRCVVHEQFTSEKIGTLTQQFPDAEVLVHWEVPDDAVESSLSVRKGLVGSTGDIINYVQQSSQQQFILGSECDLGSTLKGMFRDKEFITPCVYCSYMKKISIHNTLQTLRSIKTEQEKHFDITLSPSILQKAYLPIKRMIDFPIS